MLEQAIFFDLPTIAIDFPEYREQAIGIFSVKFVTRDNFFHGLVNCLEFLEEREKISFRGKMASVSLNVKQLVEATTRER